LPIYWGMLIFTERNVGWGDLVIDAVYARYGLDRAVMALPKKDKHTEKPAKKHDKAK
jgi:hypothetical protein